MKKPKAKKKSKSRSQKKRISASQTEQAGIEAETSDQTSGQAAPAVVKKTAVKQPSAPKAVARSGGPVVWWQKTAQFFREVKVELKKVAWPSRKETLTTTSVVVVLVLIAAVFLGLVDFGLSKLIRTLVG